MLSSVPSVPPGTGASQKSRFLVYTAGRTGSSLLLELLSNVPEIACDQEILKQPVSDVPAFLNAQAAAAEKPIYGFKLKMVQFGEQGIADPAAFLRNLHGDGWKIIHLVRENVFLMVFSFLYATERNKFFSYKFEYFRREERVRIDPDQLLRLVEENVRLLEEEEALLAGIPHLRISYEQDLEDRGSHRDCLNKISAFLGLPQRKYPLKTNLKKSVPHPKLRATNWDEIRERLVASPFARFLPPER